MSSLAFEPTWNCLEEKSPFITLKPFQVVCWVILSISAINAVDSDFIKVLSRASLVSLDDCTAVQSSNDTNDALDRTFIKSESTALIAEIDRITQQTTWNGFNVMNGDFSSKQFQVGSNANEDITVSVTTTASASIGNYQAW